MTGNQAGGPCPFCEISAGRAPAVIVREWCDALAITPQNPVVDGHTLVIPLRHVRDFAENPEVTGATARRAAQLCKELDLVHANMITSKGEHATQTVFHLHHHLVPRSAQDGLALPGTPEEPLSGLNGDRSSKGYNDRAVELSKVLSSERMSVLMEAFRILGRPLSFSLGVEDAAQQAAEDR